MTIAAAVRLRSVGHHKKAHLKWACVERGVSNYSIAVPNLKYKRKGGFGLMKSLVVKRSIIIDGHKTSVSLEDAFWNDLREIAHARQATLSELVGKIDEKRQGNLSSAIRLFVLEHVMGTNKRK